MHGKGHVLQVNNKRFHSKPDQQVVICPAELVNAADYPTAAMVNAKGMVDEQHPTFIGTYWGQVNFSFPPCVLVLPFPIPKGSYRHLVGPDVSSLSPSDLPFLLPSLPFQHQRAVNHLRPGSPLQSFASPCCSTRCAVSCPAPIADGSSAASALLCRNHWASMRYSA